MPAIARWERLIVPSAVFSKPIAGVARSLSEILQHPARNNK